MPKLLENVQELIAACDGQLDGLPESRTVDPATEILRRITAFCKSMQSIIDGTGEDRSFVHKSRAIYQTFSIRVWETAPNFQPFEDMSMFELDVHDDDNEAFDDNDDAASDGDSIASGVEIPHPGQPLGLYDVRSIIKEYVSNLHIILRLL